MNITTFTDDSRQFTSVSGLSVFWFAAILLGMFAGISPAAITYTGWLKSSTSFFEVSE